MMMMKIMLVGDTIHLRMMIAYLLIDDDDDDDDATVSLI